MSETINEVLKEGILGLQAIEMINGDRDKIYAKLLQHATKEGMSKELFDKIWVNTYKTIDKYGEGDIVKSTEHMEKEVHRWKVEVDRLKKADWRDFVQDIINE